MTDKKHSSSKSRKSSLPGELPQALVPSRLIYNKYPIHDTLKMLRQETGLTLEALSLVTKGVDPEGKGISRVSLSRYETGSEPGLRELKILSWAYRKPIAYLVYGYLRDPLADDQRDTLELILEDMICDTVNVMLERKGLIEPRLSDEDQQYAQLIEAAKKLAK